MLRPSLLKAVGAVSIWAAASSSLMVGKLVSSDVLVMGNYHGYISPDVASELHDKYGFKVDYFEHDHIVKEKFDKGIYDMAVVSTSVLSEIRSSNSVHKLDWSKFTSTSTSTSKEDLFTDLVKEMSKESLLDYGIPYFVQKLGFYYTGPKITSLSGSVSFSTLIQAISHDKRFKSDGKTPKLGLIDDPRTVLSLSRRVKGHDDINPSDHEYLSSEDILNDYKALISLGLNSSQLGSNFLFINPDSSKMVDALSNGDIKGAFMYNGDGLFAANGGNLNAEVKAEEFHEVEISDNIYFLDFVVLSPHLKGEKLEKAYNLAKELLFLKAEHESNPFSKNNEEYGSMVVRNFDYVQYPPVLKKLHEKLDCYFSNESNLKDLKQKIIKTEKPTNKDIKKSFEAFLDSRRKSDMLIAYENFKLML
ncbi:Spermidine/putrescine-binding periplasmic transport protein PotD [Mycoplasma haemocanis str. Illinois]|uniref:Spermidine/putrescine-binding periplasmic transport protein PotD n=1 Tax=Mycoplasma haemocanis (strain Illinois) TaxID=1111676 RepID=H6N8L8_MYCHN|nr:spermidine/putrescine ABC transporter substrate-binding protein [Mycoplasma haemocanis]AEW45990.1 Spermidine/putrescine-binding periplasmic transport protein PotD [Mycoplasma haemocanis str. Illinois]